MGIVGEFSQVKRLRQQADQALNMRNISVLIDFKYIRHRFPQPLFIHDDDIWIPDIGCIYKKNTPDLLIMLKNLGIIKYEGENIKIAEPDYLVKCLGTMNIKKKFHKFITKKGIIN